MISANLLPGHILHARAMRARRATWLRIGGGYAALMLGATIWLSIGSGLEPARLSAEVAQLEERRETLTREVATLRARNASLRTTVEASRAVGRQPDWSTLLDALATLMGPGIVLERLELLPPAGRTTVPSLTLRGVGDSPRDAADFALRMEGTGLFSLVTLSETRPRTVAGAERAEFTITCTFNISARDAASAAPSGGARAAGGAP